MITRCVLTASSRHTRVLIYLYGFMNEDTLGSAGCLGNHDGHAGMMHGILQRIDHLWQVIGIQAFDILDAAAPHDHSDVSAHAGTAVGAFTCTWVGLHARHSAATVVQDNECEIDA